MVHTEDYTVISFSTSIDGKTRRIFIAQANDLLRVIGSLLVELDLAGETGYIYDLYITPDRRRDGVASFLVRTAIKQLRDDEKTSSFSCKIKDKNKGSRKLFLKLGFKKSMVYEEDNAFYYTLFV